MAVSPEERESIIQEALSRLSLRVEVVPASSHGHRLLVSLDQMGPDGLREITRDYVSLDDLTRDV